MIDNQQDDSTWVHSHCCEDCGRTRECDSAHCHNPVFMQDLCFNCSGDRARRHHLGVHHLFLVLLFMLPACAPWGEAFRRSSPGVTAGAPYYRGVPGGIPIEVAPPVDYRLPGGAR